MSRRETSRSSQEQRARSRRRVDSALGIRIRRQDAGSGLQGPTSGSGVRDGTCRYPGGVSSTRRSDWNEAEIAGAIDLYFGMLDREIRGESFVKMERYRRFCERFPRRNVKAIERKCQNIAACLFEFGSPLVSGLRPRGNYQAALRLAAMERLDERAAILEAHASAPAPPPAPASLEAIDEIPGFPSRRPRPETAAANPRPPIDFAAREQANRSLGIAGERWTMEFERLRLADLGRADLAEQVRHVSLEEGDGCGFDILSFDHRSGRERLIEVKTTRAGIWTPFHLTRNEVEISRRRRDEFHLYRLHSYGRRTRLYILAGAMHEECDLDPTVYRARPRAAAG